MTVTIVIPVYNDPVGVRETIESVSHRMGSDAQLLIVDNGSTDETMNTIEEYADEHNHVKLLVEDKIQGSYAARNKGIEQATDDILAFLDADETVEEDWLQNALEAMEEQDVDYLGCKVVLTAEEDTLVGRYNAKTGFPVKEYLKEEHYAPTCALLVRREVIEDVGPFDERLVSGGDIEFGQRVHDAGYDQGYAEDAVVTHPARTSLKSLAKKNFRVGRGFCQKQRYYPERYGRPGIPPKPTGSESNDDETEPESVTTRVAFTILSLTMLACRGLGYYYEFLVGTERERRDATS